MTRNRQTGVSLIEIMVSLVAGLIVVGSILTFTVAVLQSNTQNIEATRLLQELRSVINYSAQELRRAGYDQNAIRSVKNVGSYASPFRGILINSGGDCVVYGYDRAGGTAGTAEAGEIRGIRRVVLSNGVGAIEVHRGGGTVVPSCTGAAGTYTTFPATCSSANWCPLTDARSVNVTSLAITRASTTTGSGPAIRSREIELVVTANLVNAPEAVRTLDTRVRVRADCVGSTTTALSACDTAPSL